VRNTFGTTHFGVDLESTWDVVSTELPELKGKIAEIQNELKKLGNNNAQNIEEK